KSPTSRIRVARTRPDSWRKTASRVSCTGSGIVKGAPLYDARGAAKSTAPQARSAQGNEATQFETVFGVPILLGVPLVPCNRRGGDGRVPLSIAAVAEPARGLRRGERRPIRARGRHGVPRIDHRDDARLERDIGPAQAIGVPLTIPTLVVPAHEAGHFAK